MELNRRDALAALAAVGGVAGAAALTWDALDDERTFPETRREQLVSLARLLYPTDVDGIPAFVETYTVGRVADRPEYAEGMQRSLTTLDDYARDWQGAPWLDLDSEGRDTLLREMGVDTADPDPDGLDAAQVRYYLVNELLFALYTSPRGGELVGIENPIGHPGGTASYQRPPPDAEPPRSDPQGGADG